MSSGLVRREETPLDKLTQRLLGETGELRKIFFRDLVMDFPIGAHAREQGRSQRVAVNLELILAPQAEPHGDDISKVLDYDVVRRRVMALGKGGHVNLVETLAERIADVCL
ncbi:MAG: dihydroneopterin aldolase, partial [Alphaproteobacteria bacterium]